MDNEQKSQAKPIFKPMTPERREQYKKEMDEACKVASENMKKGIYPNRKLKP